MKNSTKMLLGVVFAAIIALIIYFCIIPKPVIYASYSRFHQAPEGYKSPFKLSQNYPRKLTHENYPWLKVDFKKSPNEYMNSVLKYCLEGNLECNFQGQNNKIRTWYHAPYMHDDGRQNGNGREYVNGLTRERPTPKFEIHKKQDVELESWAVGMYNPPGGYTLNQVWNTSELPDPTKSNFPEGTVSFKLLFTNGTVDKVPFLANTLEWEANIYKCNPRKCGATERKNQTVRLLQIDIATKDKRAIKTGWVFGTFIYDASAKGESVWDRMIPVGLSWGDDSSVPDDINRDGAFENPLLEETYLNSNLVEDTTRSYGNEAYMRFHGLGGRLNGPVDNPISSCISCHGQSGIKTNGTPLPMANFSLNRQSFNSNEFITYFGDVKPGAYVRQFDGESYDMTDYSLQVAFGIRNFYQERIDRHNSSLVASKDGSDPNISILSDIQFESVEGYIKSLPEITRGE